MRLFQHEVEEGGKSILGETEEKEGNETSDFKKCVYEQKEEYMS